MFKTRHPNRKRRGNYYVNHTPSTGGASALKLLNKPVLILSVIAGAVLIVCLILEGAGYCILHHKNALLIKGNAAAVSGDGDALNTLDKKNSRLVNQIKALAPSDVYIVVDTAQNILYLKNGNQFTRKVVVSTGNGNVLTELTGSKRSWTFDTPKGEFAVKNMRTDPLWTSPDWEFISKDEEIPRNKADRIQEGVLGDYALDLGDGYMIHGTLYTRLMGKHVTHGCIRVGDDDLLAVYKSSKKGTKVFIF
jgi:L,D-transpeptidase ErfK/SrfK